MSRAVKQPSAYSTPSPLPHKKCGKFFTKLLKGSGIVFMVSLQISTWSTLGKVVHAIGLMTIDLTNSP